jgi:PadR family transcriptional regulator PadR
VGDRADLLQGSLDLLILKVLSREALHGWAISRRIRELSGDVLQVNQGSLYPALYRLRDRDLIEAESALSDEGRPVKVYDLTRKGRATLGQESRNWRLFADAVDAVLATT